MTFKQRVELKSGHTYEAGESCEVEFVQGNNSKALIVAKKDGYKFSASIENLHKYVTGISKPPGFKALEKMSDNGIATTPTGHRVEPDGHGPDGSPSWLLVIGII